MGPMCVQILHHNWQQVAHQLHWTAIDKALWVFESNWAATTIKSSESKDSITGQRNNLEIDK